MLFVSCVVNVAWQTVQLFAIFLQRCGNLLGKSSSLPKDILAFDRVDDLNKETRIEGPFINAVEFHPTATVALIAGSSGIASIVQVRSKICGTFNTERE